MDQSTFMERIREALGRPAGKRRIDTALLSSRRPGATVFARGVRRRWKRERRRLLAHLIGAAEPLSLQVHPCPGVRQAASSVAALAAEKNPEWGEAKKVVAWAHPLVDRLQLEAALAPGQVPVARIRLEGPENGTPASRYRLRQAVSEASIGVTAADYCLADTGTLVMMTRPGMDRSISLLPSIHIAVIGLDQLLADLGELYLLLGNDPREDVTDLVHCMTFITGPSKTADIEATMVHGVHGPREVHLLVIDDVRG
jgi:L-lactate dehydrogenase complex protein LldG